MQRRKQWYRKRKHCNRGMAGAQTVQFLLSGRGGWLVVTRPGKGRETGTTAAAIGVLHCSVWRTRGSSIWCWHTLAASRKRSIRYIDREAPEEDLPRFRRASPRSLVWWLAYTLEVRARKARERERAQLSFYVESEAELRPCCHTFQHLYGESFIYSCRYVTSGPLPRQWYYQ